MAIRGAGLVALLALVLLALNPGVPAEQAAAQETFELRGDFDVTLLEAGTVTANEITLSIPADGGDVNGTFHLRIEKFPFVLDLGCFNLFAPADECESDVPFPDCTITLELSGGVITGTYSADSSQLVGTTVHSASILDPANCSPDMVEGGEQISGSLDGTFDAASQFAQGAIGDPEDRLEFSAVVGSSGGQPTEEPEAEEPEAESTPTLTEDEAEQAVLDSFFGGIDLTAEQRAGLKEDASNDADYILVYLTKDGGEPTPIQRETAAFLGFASSLARLEDAGGNRLFPSFNKLKVKQVTTRLFDKASGWDRYRHRFDADKADPEAGVALERFIRLIAAMDQAARMRGGQ